ncbi:hypothetical protein ALC57_02222, partial [Trachymyrmex cornetzi]
LQPAILFLDISINVTVEDRMEEILAGYGRDVTECFLLLFLFFLYRHLGVHIHGVLIDGFEQIGIVCVHDFLNNTVSIVAWFSTGDGGSFNLYLSKQVFNLLIIAADALHTSKSLSSFRVTRST